MPRRTPRSPRRRGTGLRAGLRASLALALCPFSFAVALFALQPGDDAAPPSLPAPVADALPLAVETAEAAAPEATRPVRIRIAPAGIDAPVIPMGLQPGGKLDVPGDRGTAGWFDGGPKPGDPGTAVIDGHLDLGGKPGAFWNLKKARAGDRVEVTGEDGIPRAFRVTGTKLYDVRTADLQEIYADRPGETRLHLITCAGRWNRALGHYEQRLVVFAEAL